MERLKKLVRLGHFERRVIRKHDAARPEPDPRRHRAHVRDQDFGSRGHDARHVVMLGVPEPRVAEAIDARASSPAF